MTLNLAKLTATSAMPGLQNIGTATGTITVSGSIPINQSSILSVNFLVAFPIANVISVMRFQAPNNSGQLGSYWFPIMGYLNLYDNNGGYFIEVYVASDPGGRRVYLNFVNNKQGAAIPLNSMQYNVVAELYSYPF